MILTPWKTTTVGNFWQSFAWNGVPVSQAEEIYTQGVEFTDWRHLDVQSFFSEFSWTGVVKRSTFSKSQQQQEAPAFGYTLSVRDFLSQILWEGKPNIGAIPQLSVVTPVSQELNLNDLSNLF
jgi:hypothetical protein